MVRRAVEWVIGSIVVYILVAACATYGGGDIVAMATGGIIALVGGTSQGGTPAAGGKAAGSGATSLGASGGISIVDPVPGAEAAEDGTRIVNIYRTTPDGLKTPEGYWDKDLQIRCNFMAAEDGKERCLPAVRVGSSNLFYSDTACSVPLGYVVKGSCLDYVYVYPTAASCASTEGVKVHKPGARVSAAYQGTPDNCTAASESLLATFDIYSLTKLPASQFAEGALVHE